jgi:hypothetical protein
MTSTRLGQNFLAVHASDKAATYVMTDVQADLGLSWSAEPIIETTPIWSSGNQKDFRGTSRARVLSCRGAEGRRRKGLLTI